jgi:hypothetical protein
MKSPALDSRLPLIAGALALATVLAALHREVAAHDNRRWVGCGGRVGGLGPAQAADPTTTADPPAVIMGSNLSVQRGERADTVIVRGGEIAPTSTLMPAVRAMPQTAFGIGADILRRPPDCQVAYTTVFGQPASAVSLAMPTGVRGCNF